MVVTTTTSAAPADIENMTARMMTNMLLRPSRCTTQLITHWPMRVAASQGGMRMWGENQG